MPWTDEPISIHGGGVSGGILVINILYPKKISPNPREIRKYYLVFQELVEVLTLCTSWTI